MNSKRAANEFQNDFQYAGFGERLKAFTYDYLVIFVYILLLAGVNYGIILMGGVLEKVSPLFASAAAQDVIAFLTLILPVMLYFTFEESSPRQGTWGKRKRELRVANISGMRLSRGKAFLRAAVKFLPWQIAHTSIYQSFAGVPGNKPPLVSLIGFGLAYFLVGVYILSSLISKQHRTPYDWIAGSFVVVDRVDEGILQKSDVRPVKGSSA